MKNNKLKLLGVFLLGVVLFWACSKDEVKPEPKPKEKIKYDKVEENVVGVSVQLPKNSVKDDFILTDSKGRNLKIENGGKSDIEANTTVTLINKKTNKLVYIGYFPKTTATKSGTATTYGNNKKDCEEIYKVGAMSSAKFILSAMLLPVTVFQFGTAPDTKGLGEIYKSALVCNGVSSQTIEKVSKIIEEGVQAGKDLATVILGENLKASVQHLTGGLFSDCWDILAESIVEGKVKFDSHPYQDYLISKKVYNKENRDVPSVLLDFTNQKPNGVIIKSAEEIKNTGKWKIELDVYNSLPIPFAIRLGKKNEKEIPVPANDKTEYFVASNGMAIVQQIKNGAGCQGFINNITDSYYAISSEGVAVRSSDFSKTTVTFEFDTVNNYIIFEGPKENIRVAVYHFIENLFHVVDFGMSVDTSSCGKENKNKFTSFVKKLLVDIILKDEKARSFFASSNKSYKEQLKFAGRV